MRRALLTGLSALLLVVAACGSADNGAGPESAESPEETAPPAEQPQDPEAGDEAAPDEYDAEAAEDVLRDYTSQADIALPDGARVIHLNLLQAAIEEVWIVDAPLDEVIAFYAQIPGLEQLPDSAITSDDGGGYVELEIFDLVKAGETDRAVYEAAVAEAPFGPLMRVAVVTPESQMLAWFGRPPDGAVPPDHTVIVFGVLVG